MAQSTNEILISLLVHKQGKISLRNDKRLISQLINLQTCTLHFSSLWQNTPIAINDTHSVRKLIISATVPTAVKDKLSVVPYIVENYSTRFRKNAPFILAINQLQ